MAVRGFLRRRIAGSGIGERSFDSLIGGKKKKRRSGDGTRVSYGSPYGYYPPRGYVLVRRHRKKRRQSGMRRTTRRGVAGLDDFFGRL